MLESNIELSEGWRAIDARCDIRKLVPLGALDDVVKDQDHAMVAAFKDQNILILGLLVM